ncbi:PASTA domain-containing protein [Streptomyces sp. NPDC001904]|uniref:PASTA domain-containing protein n=1 Tax=Streptomyces sp. NPDC001904 TaxID=3154531 RepID=UPI00331F6D0A
MPRTPETPSTPDPPEVHVPALVGLMAVDAQATALAFGLRLIPADRPALDEAAVDHVVRQYPLPGVEIPRDAAVTVWFDFGEGEGGGGAGVREPLGPGPRGGGMRRELDEPAAPLPFTPCP